MNLVRKWHAYRAAYITRTMERLGHERDFHLREVSRLARHPFQGRAVLMIETRGCMAEQDYKTMFGRVKEVFAPRNEWSRDFMITVQMQDNSEHKVYASNFFESADGSLVYRY